MLTNTAGCDSLAILNLTVKDTVTTVTDSSVCRSLLPFNWNGNSYSATGTYSVMLMNVEGCDSIAILNLTVTDSSSSNTDTSICATQFPFSWNGNNYSAAGVYSVTLINSAGCDSLATLRLVSRQTSSSNTNVQVCSNQLPYSWNGNNYTADGMYTVTLVNAMGCDSVATLNLVVNDTSTSITHINICQDQLPYSWNGNSYAATGVYTVTLANAFGCDSIAALNLAVKDTSTSINNISICQNQLPFNWNGNSYTAAGVYSALLINAAGCDSVAILQLTVKDTSFSVTDLSICSNGLPYSWNGNSYAAPGIYTVTMVNAAGCDSIAALLLTVKDTSFSTTDTSICPSAFPFSWNGNSYTTEGDYSVRLVNAAGCDSMANFHGLLLQAKQ